MSVAQGVFLEVQRGSKTGGFCAVNAVQCQVAVTQSLNAARQSPPRQPPAALSAAKAPPQYARLVTPLRQLPHTPRATPFSFQWQPSQSQLQNVASVTSSTISSPALLTPRRVAVSPAPHRPATQEQTQRSPQGPLSYRPAIPAQPAPTERHKEAKGRLDVACPSDGHLGFGLPVCGACRMLKHVL